MAIPRSIKTAEIQAATTILAAETIIGAAIDTRNFNTLTVYIDFVAGDEDYWELIPKFLRMPTDDEHQLTDWSTDASAVPTQKKFRFEDSIKTYIVLDVRGLNMIKLYGDATGGTPTGTVQIGYTLVSE